VHARYQAIVEEVTHDHREFATNGHAELTTEFAVPFSIRVAARILGIGLADTAAVERLYSDLAAAMSYDTDPGPLARAASARAELDELLRPEVARLRSAPTRLGPEAAPGHERLTDAELLAQLRVILFGAIETIASSVLSSVLLLLTHPDQLATARAAPGGWVAAVDEALRLIPPVAFIERWAASDIELDGVDITQGELIGICVVAANRDPATFPAPLVFDVSRSNAARGLSFAFGTHTCLGAQLARVQTAVAVQALPNSRMTLGQRCVRLHLPAPVVAASRVERLPWTPLDAIPCAPGEVERAGLDRGSRARPCPGAFIQH
jgi:hypothetical protein